MDHFVTLSRWPEGLEIPAEYSQQVIVDPVRRRLGYHGYMRKADFDSLASISKDPVYLDALQDLFAHATYEGPGSKRRSVLWIVAGSLTAVGAAAAAIVAILMHRHHQ